jgi:hypothetical protein
LLLVEILSDQPVNQSIIGKTTPSHEKKRKNPRHVISFPVLSYPNPFDPIVSKGKNKTRPRPHTNTHTNSLSLSLSHLPDVRGRTPMLFSSRKKIASQNWVDKFTRVQ